jgi:hypothetical protein
MKTLILSVAMMLWSAAPLSAQVTTGRLIGTVVDDGGTPLSGATLTIESPALIGGPQSRVSDELGEFAFRNLAPGHYSVVAALAGYSGQEWNRVKVPLGGAASVHVVLERASFTGEIRVVDETPVVDPTQVHSGQVFDQRYMQASAVGSANRSYTAIATQTAGVAGGAIGGGVLQPRVFGSTLGENAYFIDGMDATDPLTAYATVAINFDTIAEIQLQTGGYEAEYGRATGGVLNLVTKSGGNRFSGTIDIRYRDQSFQESGEYFDTSELDTSYEEISLTLGGPILRDSLWFFTSYQRIDDQFTPTGSTTTRDTRHRNYLAKLTWQIAPSWRLSGKYARDPTDVDNADASQFVLREATSEVDEGTTVASADLTAVLSDSLLWGATVGAYTLDSEVRPQSGDLETIGHYNYVTNLWSHNYRDQSYSKNSRTDFTTDLTWFVANLGGSHEVKAGVEYSAVEQTLSSCYTGTANGQRCVEGVAGFLFRDILAGDGSALPFLMDELQPRYEATYSGDVSTVFLQDAWRVTRNLTLKLGLRYDTVTYDNNEGARVADMGELQPRIGLAWDLTGNAKNVVRASWGRFMHPGALSIPVYATTQTAGLMRWRSCSGWVPFPEEYGGAGVPISSPEECATLASSRDWAYRLDSELWDPFGWIFRPSDASVDDSIYVVPGLQPTYSDELILAYEREVGKQSSVELMFIDKKTRDVIDDTCSDNVPTPQPDAECDTVAVTNISEGRRDYRGVVLSFESRALGWLTLLASYTYSSSRGSIEYTQNRGSDFDIYPWHYENRYGYLSDHRRHRLKLNGFVTLSGDWNIAFDAYWASPFTWQPTEYASPNTEFDWGRYFLEPRGSREANSNYQLDLQLAKGFTVGRTRLVAIGTAYSVFSSEQPYQVCDRVRGCGEHIATGDPIGWQTPRRYELGFRVEF